MSNRFFSTITNAGAEKLALAASNGEKLSIKYMAVGDGGGLLPTPQPGQIKLINEMYRSELNRLSVSISDNQTIEAEMIMPPQVGGFWLREVALFSEDGICVAVGNMPESYKPLLSQGAGRFQVVVMLLKVSSTGNIKVLADPSIVLATSESVKKAEDGAKDYADSQLNEHEKSRNHPDATLEAKGFTQLSSKIDSDSELLAATPRAVMLAMNTLFNSMYPVGISVFFAQNKDPNNLWSDTKWAYTGENKTIRLAKKDGSNILATGGSDSIKINRENLPVEQISVSGTTDEHNTGRMFTEDTDLGVKQTSSNGKHVHEAGWGGPGQKWGERTTGTDNQGRHDMSYTSEDGEHVHDIELGPHNHEIPEIRHAHAVKAKTDNLGEAKEIDIVNSYITLACWYRVA